MSNVHTGVVNRITDHPIREYFEHGLLISVNTDDPKMFNTSLADEYRALVQNCGFSKKEICTIILLTLESSWLSEDKKNSLRKKIELEPSWKAIMN
jgi:adenosine deaminase